MTHSPEKIIQQFLIDAGVGIDPADDGDWKVYCHHQPDSGDSIITVFGTQGIPELKPMREDKLKVVHYGIMVQVRSKDPEAAKVKVQAVVDYLNTEIKNTDFNYGPAPGSDYKLHSFTQTSDVLPLGLEEKNRRTMFSVNGTITMEEV